MHILRSLGDGIGTAAGVAWPTFGIVFATLGLTIGQFPALILGAISLGLFLFVGLPITYWSFKNRHKEEKELDEALVTNEKKCIELILTYLLAVSREFILEASEHHQEHLASNQNVDTIRLKILKDLRDWKQVQHPQITRTLLSLVQDKATNNIIACLLQVLSHYNYVFPKDSIRKQILTSYISTYFHLYSDVDTKEPRLKFTQIKAGIMGFTAAFGSIAGCSAGSLSLLSSLGLFAGFSALPIVGWSVLATALCFGILIAGICVYNSYDSAIKQKKVNYYHKVNNSLEDMILIKTITAKARFDSQNSLNSSINVQALTNRNKRTASPVHQGSDFDIVFFQRSRNQGLEAPLQNQVIPHRRFSLR